MRFVRPPEPETRTRFAETFNPEVVAALLVAALVVGGLLSVATAPRSNPAASPGAQIATARPSATTAAIVSASPAPTSLGSPSSLPATASPTLTPTTNMTPPPWAASARLLVAADEKLIEWREILRRELGSDPSDAAGLARQMGAASAWIQFALTSIGDLDHAGAPDDLVERLLAPHTLARQAALRTLAVPIRNVGAYRTGATDVVSALTDLEPLMRDVAAAAGQPDPVPHWVPSPAVGLESSSAP